MPRPSTLHTHTATGSVTPFERWRYYVSNSTALLLHWRLLQQLIQSLVR